MDIQCLNKEESDNLLFGIQTSNPRFQKKINFSDKCLADAIESIFLLNTENAILIWNHISISLSYKYDISYMLDDILELLFALQNQDKGKLLINWLPDTFRSDWLIVWEEGKIEIQSQWECTTGHLESILNQKNHISLSVVEFINEWKGLLEVVINGLITSGYNRYVITGMDKLIEQYENISEYGILYKNN